MEKRGKRVDCPALPPGWKKEEVIRKSGLSAGKSDVYYFSNGSRPEMRKGNLRFTTCRSATFQAAAAHTHEARPYWKPVLPRPRKHHRQPGAGLKGTMYP
ncbi:UNVERIFIED_CONTAM: hypothetical protein K2H54_066808 [Gekko kuhli]